MRFLFILPDFQGGGAERMTISLVAGLRAAGHDARIIVLRDLADHDVPNTIPVSILVGPDQKFGTSFRRRLRDTWKLRSLVRRMERDGRFDLVVSALPHADGLLRRIKHPRTLFHIHGPFHHELFALREISRRKSNRWLRRYKAIYDGANILTVAPGLANELRENCTFRVANDYPQPNAVEPEIIRALSAEPEPDLPTRPFLLHVARPAPLKRHDLMIEAFERSVIDADLVLLGKLDDRVLQLVSSSSRATRIHTPGFRANPYPWMRAARVVVVTSDFEGLPMVLLEALACGTPVVSSDCPGRGSRQVMRGNLAPFLFPLGDADALADCLRRVMANPPKIEDAALDGFRMRDAVASLERVAALPKL
ncbi:glycosyltransferase [Tepidamorphus sp. 3E244]|uniref:glycosyltransferase n=1 Tax=Tepidamorphus sp. 3E244 TaxID=3385498 RepID=UPI0038FC6A98